MILFHHAGRNDHGGQGHGNIVFELGEQLLGHHGPCGTAACAHPVQLLRDLLQEVMGLFHGAQVRADVDFVLTFEELLGMFDAKEIDFATIEADSADGMNEGSGMGRGFAVGGGVAAAVVEAIRHIDPDREVLIEYGDGLKECRKMLAMAKAGKRNGYLLEGMGCPGGCVAGAGTISQVKDSMMNVERFKNDAAAFSTTESPYLDRLKEVEEKC